MGEKVEKKQLCRCETCGNEAEMTFVCSLPDEDEKTAPAPEKTPQPEKAPQQVKGTATCTSCGNEADMWIDI